MQIRKHVLYVQIVVNDEVGPCPTRPGSGYATDAICLAVVGNDNFSNTACSLKEQLQRPGSFVHCLYLFGENFEVFVCYVSNIAQPCSGPDPPSAC